MDTTKLKKELEQFSGTNKYHKITILPLLATDGIKYFADKTKTYWLFNDIAVIYYETGKHPFLSINVISKYNKCKIIYDDGNNNIIHSQKYHFTDLPEGRWKFFLCNNTIMLPNEY